MIKLFLISAVLILVISCGKSGDGAYVELKVTPISEVKQEPLPTEIKQQIQIDIRNGARLNSVVRTGGTGQFAAMNGGELETINSRGDTVHKYEIKAEWAEDTKEWLKTLQ